MINQLQEALDNFAELNIDLGLLQGERMFLDIHVGTVPRSNVGQLKEAIKLANYLLFNYKEHANNAHVVVVGPKGGRESDLRLVLDTAGFRPLSLPPELHDEPDKIRLELQHVVWRSVLSVCHCSIESRRVVLPPKLEPVRPGLRRFANIACRLL